MWRAAIPPKPTLGAPRLTFNATNFDIPQTVAVSGMDDGIRDGDQNYQITLRKARLPIRIMQICRARISAINVIMAGPVS